MDEPGPRYGVLPASAPLLLQELQDRVDRALDYLRQAEECLMARRSWARILDLIFQAQDALRGR